MPARLPFEWLVVNTLLVEAALGFAFYWFIVRRAGNKRRAAAIFGAAFFLTFGAEVLVLVEELRTPRWQGPRVLDIHRPTGIVEVVYSWSESRLLRRETRRSVHVVFRNPTRFPRDYFPSFFGELELGYVHDDPSGTTVAQDADLVDALWPWHDARRSTVSCGEVYAAFCRSRIARTDPAVAALVSRIGP